MASRLLFLCSLFIVSYSYQLAPFIAWSNSDIVEDLPISDDISVIVDSLVTEIGSIDKIVIFTSDELSFDEFNKYAGVYDETKQSQLKTEIESSESHYWTGTRIAANDDWMTSLADKGDIRYMNSDEVHLSDLKFVVINLNDLSSQDNVIASVMKETQGLSFLAIYTHSSSLIKHRARRDVNDDGIEARAITPPLGAANDNRNNTSCRMGGQFLEPGVNSTASCLLFCLKSITYNFTLNGEPKVMCALSTPYDITACCSDQNYTSGCYGDVPYVQFNFTAGTTNLSDNICSNTSFAFDSANIVLKFLFPFTSNVPSKWSVMIESSLSIAETSGTNYQEYFENITRANPSRNLYQPFELNEGLSYACAANEYNRYMHTVNQTNASVSVMLHSFQVQPYSVSTNSFASADNCEGYFTSTTWMGIVTVVVLLLILYLSLLCVFSMHTIDRFEDPRGQSITVEKLH